MELFSIIIRTIFFYFFICLSYRIMGKREVGQLGIIDLIVSILIAELVAISIEEVKNPMYYTIIPVAILVTLEVLLAFLSCKSKLFRKYFNGRQSLIIINGKINFKEMIKQRYTLDDLLLQLRQRNIKTISEVEYGILETNGKLSIFKYNSLKVKSDYPLPIILDGKVQIETLNNIHKTESWLLELLTKEHVMLEEVFYSFYQGKKLYIIKHSDLI